MHRGKKQFIIQSACVLLALPFSHVAISASKTDHTWHYMDAALTKPMVVEQQACFEAAPNALLAISPYKEKGQRFYRVENIIDELAQRELYAIPVEDQIKNQRIAAKKMCHGMASLSDMNLPFTKFESGYIEDANDGLHLLREARYAVVQVVKLLEGMNDLAIEAANGTNSDEQRKYLDQKYQELMRQLNNYATNTMFKSIYLLDGSSPWIKVPTQHGKSSEYIFLINAKTEKDGFDLGGTTIKSNVDASRAINQLAISMDMSMKTLNQYKSTNHVLLKMAKADATSTIIDLNNDQFTITKK
jgi:hypothetical protein